MNPFHRRNLTESEIRERNLIIIDEESIKLLKREVKIIEQMEEFEQLTGAYNLEKFESRNVGALQSHINELIEIKNEIIKTYNKNNPKYVYRNILRLEKAIENLEQKLIFLEEIHMTFKQKVVWPSKLRGPLNRFIKDTRKMIGEYQRLIRLIKNLKKGIKPPHVRSSLNWWTPESESYIRTFDG